MKVLVLGATGLLGANLVRALLARGDHVRVLVRAVQSGVQATRHHLALQGLEVERTQGSLGDSQTLTRACEGAQVVYHCAGYHPNPERAVSVDQATAQALDETRSVLAAVRRASVERLVFASSMTTIGIPSEPGRLATEDCPFHTRFTRNPYLMAKVVMEEAVVEAAKSGLPSVIIVPSMFLGPYDTHPSSGTQIIMIAKRQMPAYVDGPVNVIDVRDVAVAMIQAAERGRIGERYLVGNWNTRQRELGALIAREAGVTAPFLPMPFALARLGTKVGDWAFRTILRRPPPVPAFFVEMLKHMQHYDCAKAIRELDYPRHPVDAAIRDALAWFRANGYLNPSSSPT